MAHLIGGRVPGPSDLANALVPGYNVPSRIEPLWQTGYLVYKGGFPSLPRQSMCGGGDWVPKTFYGWNKPVIYNHVGPTVSAVGGGTVPAFPPFITRLGLNPSGNNRGY